MGEEGEEKEEKEADSAGTRTQATYSLSMLKMKTRGTERFTHLPKATQQDVNQACLAGKPAFVQNMTYCRLIKVVTPAGHLTVPHPTPPPPETVPMAPSQTIDPASWAGQLLRGRGSRLTT